MTKQEMETMLSTMSNEELDMVKRMAELEKDERLFNRRNELWGNVVAAIKKYKEQIQEEIILYERDGDGRSFYLVTDCLNNPGKIYFD